MGLFNASLWPLYCACALLLIAAIINLRSLTVPNLLSLPAILAGWFVAFCITASAEIPAGGGGILPSVVASIIGFLLLVPFYKSVSLGAGCVKMQMAFGAWVGCAVGLPAAVQVTVLGTLVGALFTAVGVLNAALRIRSYDGVGVCSHLFPAQVTLSLGSVCGVVAAGLIGWI
jgi:prepilin signal peptidase PulO-like enzyme (type II secretory pathway)